MQVYTYNLSQQEINELERKLKEYKVEASSPYIAHQWKPTGCTITAYTSKKVVFQGPDSQFYADNFKPKQASFKTHAGSDEVGTGDYFGPVCVCACYVDEKSASELLELKVQDSKAMTDDIILSIGERVMELCPHSLLILDNEKYNSIHAHNNMNKIKARLHNQAYLHLSKKIKLPELSVVDQFTPETLYYNYLKEEPTIIRTLHFETKAEGKYLAVACASVIARYAFLKAWVAMESKFDFLFPKGAGDTVDKQAAAFVQQFGEDKLKKVAKLHFKNTEKLKQYL